MDRRAFLRCAAATTGIPVVIAAASPATIGLSTALGIDLAFQRFQTANTAWLADRDDDGDITAEGPIYEEAWATCKNVIVYRCTSSDEVQRKLDLVLSDRWLIEAAQTGYDEDIGYLTEPFLRSLRITA